MIARPIEDARHRQAAERARRHHGHGFRRGVVDDRQALQHAAFGRAIEDEVRRPHLVRRLRPGQRLAIRQRHLLPPPAPDLQPRLRVEPIDPLVIDHPPFLAQFQIDHAGAVAAMTMRQRGDPVTQRRIGIRPRHVPQRGGAHAHDGQRAPLAEPAA